MNPKHSSKYCHSIFLIQQIKLPTVSSLTMACYFQETKGNSNNCFVLLLLLLIAINFVLLLKLYATTPPTSSSTASSSPSLLQRLQLRHLSYHLLFLLKQLSQAVHSTLLPPSLPCPALPSVVPTPVLPPLLPPLLTSV